MSRSAYATKASSAYFAGTSAVLTLMFEDEVTRQLMIALTKKRRKWEALRVQQALSHAEVNVNLSAKTMLISDYLCESLDKSPKRRQPAAHPLGDIPAIDHDGCGFNKVGATPVARRPSFGSGRVVAAAAKGSKPRDAGRGTRRRSDTARRWSLWTCAAPAGAGATRRAGPLDPCHLQSPVTL